MTGEKTLASQVVGLFFDADAMMDCWFEKGLASLKRLVAHSPSQPHHRVRGEPLTKFIWRRTGARRSASCRQVLPHAQMSLEQRTKAALRYLQLDRRFL